MAKLSSTDRVLAAANRAGLDIEIVEMPASTRTAEEAAAACGCSVAEIVKSLVYLGAESDTVVLLLVSGVNRVDEAAVGRHLGEVLTRPNGRTSSPSRGVSSRAISRRPRSPSSTTGPSSRASAAPRLWQPRGTQAPLAITSRAMATRSSFRPRRRT